MGSATEMRISIMEMLFCEEVGVHATLKMLLPLYVCTFGIVRLVSERVQWQLHPKLVRHCIEAARSTESLNIPIPKRRLTIY